MQNDRQNYRLVYSNFQIFWQQTRRQKALNRMIASITRIQFPLNFLRNQILVCYWTRALQNINKRKTIQCYQLKFFRSSQHKLYSSISVSPLFCPPPVTFEFSLEESEGPLQSDRPNTQLQEKNALANVHDLACLSVVSQDIGVAG
jgi:hypothetical protein